VNESLLSLRWVSRSARVAVERRADDVEALLEPVRWLVGEAEPEDVGGVAEPRARGDQGPLPREEGVEAVDVLGSSNRDRTVTTLAPMPFTASSIGG
jgi:hypothetical protein